MRSMSMRCCRPVWQVVCNFTYHHFKDAEWSREVHGKNLLQCDRIERMAALHTACIE